MNNLKATLGEIKNKTHYYPVHIFYNHTDAGGIMYFANYLRITEEARVAFFLLNDKEGFYEAMNNGDFVVKNCFAEYHKSAVLNDDLIVKTKVVEIGKASVNLTQDIYRGDELLVEVKYKLAYVKFENGKPKGAGRLPEFWIDKSKMIMD